MLRLSSDGNERPERYLRKGVGTARRAQWAAKAISRAPPARAAFTPLARTAASAERLGGASTLPGPERRTAVTLNEGLPCHESTTLRNVTDQGNEEERPAFGNRMREQSRRWADMQRFRHWVIFVSNACESRRLTRPPEAAEAAFLVRTTRTCRPR